MVKKKKKNNVVVKNTLIYKGKKVLIDFDGNKHIYRVYTFNEEVINRIFTDKFPPGIKFADDDGNMFEIFPQADLYNYDIIDPIINEYKEKKAMKKSSVSRKTATKSLTIDNNSVIETEGLDDQEEGQHVNSKETVQCKIKKRAKRIKLSKPNTLKNVKSDKTNISVNRSTEDNTRNINYKDFLIKHDTFKCWNKNHHIVDVTANVDVIGKNHGDPPKQIKVAAGYCSECNLFFILESGYKKLRDYGIPMCRISDEKNYKETLSTNNMHLASESILKQYGYNVNKTEDILDEVRHAILASIIDNHILTKNDIISYIDFFISPRKSQLKFEMAISKWEIDREFVHNYHIGEFAQYGIRGLYRSRD